MMPSDEDARRQLETLIKRIITLLKEQKDNRALTSEEITALIGGRREDTSTVKSILTIMLDRHLPIKTRTVNDLQEFYYDEH